MCVCVNYCTCTCRSFFRCCRRFALSFDVQRGWSFRMQRPARSYRRCRTACLSATSSRGQQREAACALLARLGREAVGRDVLAVAARVRPRARTQPRKPHAHSRYTCHASAVMLSSLSLAFDVGIIERSTSIRVRNLLNTPFNRTLNY